MTKPPTAKQQVNARLPSDLIEWMTTQPGSQTDVIVRAIEAMKDGGVQDVHLVPGLEAEVDRLKAEIAKWKAEAQAKHKVAQSLMPMSNAKPVKRHSPVTSLMGNPVLADVVPPGLTGSAPSFFKRSAKV